MYEKIFNTTNKFHATKKTSHYTFCICERHGKETHKREGPFLNIHHQKTRHKKKPRFLFLSVCSAFLRTHPPLQTCLWMSQSPQSDMGELEPNSEFRNPNSIHACLLWRMRVRTSIHMMRGTDGGRFFVVCNAKALKIPNWILWSEGEKSAASKDFCFWIGPLKSHSIPRRWTTDQLSLFRQKITRLLTLMTWSG